MSLSAATPASSPRTARRQMAVDNDTRNGSLASARRALRIVDSVSLSASAKRPSRVAATERTATAMPCSAQFDAPAERSAAKVASLTAAMGSPATRATNPRRARSPPNHHVSVSAGLVGERERLGRAVEIQHSQAVQTGRKVHHELGEGLVDPLGQGSCAVSIDCRPRRSCSATRTRPSARMAAARARQ